MSKIKRIPPQTRQLQDLMEFFSILLTRRYLDQVRCGASPHIWQVDTLTPSELKNRSKAERDAFTVAVIARSLKTLSALGYEPMAVLDGDRILRVL